MSGDCLDIKGILPYGISIFLGLYIIAFTLFAVEIFKAYTGVSVLVLLILLRVMMKLQQHGLPL